MPLSYVVSSTANATTAPSVPAESGYVWLFHGSREKKIESIINVGLDEEQAKQSSTDGSFWATQDWWEAIDYSQMPPHDQGNPSILGFQLQMATLEGFLQQNPPLAEEHLRGIDWYLYNFFAPSFPILNSGMTAVTVFPNITMNVEF